VYRAPNAISFVVLELVTSLVVVLVSVCTCGLGAVVAVPVSAFYIQNAAYHKGIIS
jgi:H+/Cl- antiporter ClcA